MKLSEKIKTKKFIYLTFISALILIIFVVTIVGWNIITSQEELKLTVINTYGEEMRISFWIFEGSEDDFSFDGRETSVDPNESYMFQFNIDKSFKIFKVLIRAWDSSHSFGKPNVYQFYNFRNNKVHDLLAVIDTSGNIMTVVEMPESKYSIEADFS